ncbi:MAG: hypothetical protein AAF349_28140, partial [Cyanobacteria bacterium P01_A01_bin.68]
EVISLLFEKIVDRINKPILIACNNKEEPLYININFQQIEIQKLPVNVRFHGWLNKLFGGKILRYLP